MGDIARGWSTARVTVGVAATKIADNSVSKNCILIKNMGPATLYVGPSNTVNTATGYPMNKNESISFGLQERSYQVPGWKGIEIWGIALAPVTVAVMQEIN